MTDVTDSSVRLSMALDLTSKATSKIIDGEGHRILSDPSARVDTPTGSRPAQSVAWFLEHDRWEDGVADSCGHTGCLTHLRLEGVTVEEAEAKVPLDEDPLLKLVERTSVTLADLYRKGRAKGLLAPRSDYK